MKTIIEITEDGSHTLFVPGLDEHYHSVHGAVRESLHVYLDAGFGKCAKDASHVLEIGFGTGLNAFLTLMKAARSRKTVYYTALELYPVSVADAEKLNFAALLAPEMTDVFLRLHTSEWERPIPITSSFWLCKHFTDFAHPAAFCPEEKFDLIFFDAFAPDKQPEMWTQPIFDHLYSLCSDDAVLTTYCAKGAVRRMLQKAGFEVERLPGPPGKREMLRAQKISFVL